MPDVRHAVIFSSGGKYLLKIISLISTMLIARLLTPEEIGTFAIASSVVMIMAEFRIMGANAYLVREKTISTQSIRSAYGLTILMSWSFGILIAGSSSFLSNYFNIPDIALIFTILSISFIFAPFISIPHALLSRDYRFKEIVLIKICSASLQLLITVQLINLGYGYFALAWGHLFAMFVQLALSLYLTRTVNVYMPTFKGIKPIAKLGVFTSIAHVLRKSQHTVPDIVIGKMGSPTQVGMFSRGLGFVNFITDLVLQGISPVTLPYLSGVKNNKQDLTDAYTYATKLILVIVLPVLVVASVASLPAIRLMFGPQWDAAAPIATALTYWSMLKSIHFLSSKALIAYGYEKIMLLKEAFVFSCFVLLIINAFTVGLIHFSYAFVVVAIIDLLASGIIMNKVFYFSNKGFFKELLPTLLITLTCWAVVKLLDYLLPFSSTPPLIILAYLVFVMPATWSIMVLLTRHPINSEFAKAYGLLRLRK